MRVPPPITISPQAQALLRDAAAITARSMELAAIQERRKASAAAYVPATRKLANGLGVMLTEEMISDVRTQVVAPMKVTGSSAIL